MIVESPKHETTLGRLLAENAEWEFSVDRIRDPNGWRIIGSPRGLSFVMRALKSRYAIECPPSTIRTSDREMAEAMEESLGQHGYVIHLEM